MTEFRAEESPEATDEPDKGESLPDHETYIKSVPDKDKLEARKDRRSKLKIKRWFKRNNDTRLMRCRIR